MLEQIGQSLVKTRGKSEHRRATSRITSGRPLHADDDKCNREQSSLKR